MEAKSRYAFGHVFVDVYYGVNVNFHVYLNGQSQQLREPFLFTGIFQPELVLKFKFLRVLLFCNRQHKEYIHISQNWHVLQWISTHLNPSDKCSLEDVSRCFLSIERLPSWHHDMFSLSSVIWQFLIFNKTSLQKKKISRCFSCLLHSEF